MKLKDFEEILLERNDIIEYTAKDEQYSKATKLAYYMELVKEIPKELCEGRPSPPFAVVANFKDKNGCFQDTKDMPIEDIMHIKRIGKSCIKFS